MSDQPTGGLFVLDAHGLIYRAFHAIPELTASDGTPTNALFGFIRILTRIRDQWHPDYWAVVFDAPGPTFRHQLAPEYKANRPPMPDTLRPQLGAIKEFLHLAGLLQLEERTVEADDLIASLAASFRATVPVRIVSNDKDVHQLVGDGVVCVAFKSGISEAEVRDRAAVIAKFGVAPEQLRDYLALIGDTSDNIAGLAGVGPKTAADWLTRYGDLDGIYAHLDQLGTPARIEKVKGARETLLRSRRLITLKADVPIPTGLDRYQRAGGDPAGLRDFFARYDLHSLAGAWDAEAEPKQLHLLEPPPAAQGGASVAAGTGGSSAATAAPAAGKEQPAAFVFAAHGGASVGRSNGTSCSRCDTSPSVDIAAGTGSSSAATAAPEVWWVSRGGKTEPLPDRAQSPAWRRLWRDRKLVLVGYELKEFWKASRELGLGPELRDLRLVAYLTNPEFGNATLEKLGLRFLGLTELPTPEIALDAIRRLDAHFAPHPIEPQLWALERDLIPVLGEMELNGVRVDRPWLESLRAKYRARLTAIESEVAALAGETINLNSPKQLAVLLFDKLGLARGKKTAGKTAYSTDVSVLEKLQDRHPLIPKILQHRTYAKLLSTYVEGLLAAADPAGRVTTRFNQTATATGRLSSSEPNLQNIPVRTPEGMEIRRAFVPLEPGHLLLAADYSQIELRVLAHLAAEPALIAAFHAGADIHTATAAAVFGVPAEQVTREQRRQAKTVNFGVIYGMSAFGLAADLGISRPEAKRFIDSYFARYPNVRRYLDEVLAHAQAAGWVQTLTGRKRYLPELKAGPPAQREFAKRAAINMPVQGTAADIIKLAMLAVRPLLPKYDARLLLQVHDELIFDVPKGKAGALQKALAPAMAGVMQLAVPLTVDFGTGANWCEVSENK